ncbi:hypothetical protein M434DRAFT_395303 [Hypoxylon sp. CO27-5]|nr:hypothetical protein M434DRAFT_395303 [Hypoxylon sp. CO27-5]
MRVSNIISITAIGSSGVLAQSNNGTSQGFDAPVTTGNPAGVSARAVLPPEAFWTSGSLSGNVEGYVLARSSANGSGLDYEVSFSNLPTEGGPFIYHVHVAPVPADGNCTSTLAHLDQTGRGENPICDPTQPASCQQGDLSGKYGNITDTSLSYTFHDPYTSLREGDGAYIGNRSFVFHFLNKTRISCANFTVSQPNTSTPYPTSSGSGIRTSPTPTTLPVPGAGSVLNVAKNFAIAPMVAAFLALL